MDINGKRKEVVTIKKKKNTEIELALYIGQCKVSILLPSAACNKNEKKMEIIIHQ